MTAPERLSLRVVARATLAAGGSADEPVLYASKEGCRALTEPHVTAGRRAFSQPSLSLSVMLSIGTTSRPAVAPVLEGLVS
jgi:hypothetical protein